MDLRGLRWQFPVLRRAFDSWPDKVKDLNHFPQPYTPEALSFAEVSRCLGWVAHGGTETPLEARAWKPSEVVRSKCIRPQTP